MNTTPTKEPPKEPQEGVSAHLKRMRGITQQFRDELDALQRIEKSLTDAIDRLERHTNLMTIETQLVDGLLKHERLRPADVRVLPSAALADKVEQDLAQLVPRSFRDGQSQDMAVSIPPKKGI